MHTTPDWKNNAPMLAALLSATLGVCLFLLSLAERLDLNRLYIEFALVLPLIILSLMHYFRR